MNNTTKRIVPKFYKFGDYYINPNMITFVTISTKSNNHTIYLNSPQFSQQFSVTSAEDIKTLSEMLDNLTIKYNKDSKQ